MITKKFTKEFLREEILWGGKDKPGEPCLILDKITDNGRWSIHHKIVFRDADGLFFQSHYSVGATENQDESPWEYDPEEIECEQVQEVEKLVKVWEPIS